MLFAINKYNERVKASHKTNKDVDYYCPICKTKVIIRKGKINMPHFSHISKTQCIYSQYYKDKASFSKHKEMIKYTAQYFKSYDCIKKIDLEKSIIENRISDIVITLDNDVKFVVECDFRKIDYNLYKDVTHEYNKHGYAVLWVLDEKVIDLYSQLASCYMDKNHKLFSLRKNKNINNSTVENTSLVENYEKDYLNNNSCIYINKRKILIDNSYVVRLGIGSMKGKKGTIVQYGIDENSVEEYLK